MKQTNLSPRASQLAKYNTARMNLLLVAAFTAINVILGLTGSGTYFLFSAFIPYYLVIDGMFSCGKMPADWYEGDMSEWEFYDSSYLIIMVVIAVVILALYVVFWLLSKKQSGWLIAALVFFAIDSVLFLVMGGFSLDSVFDLLFHAWVLYYLISGIVAANKLKTMPLEEELYQPVEENVE